MPEHDARAHDSRMGGPCRGVDAITRHRLASLGLDADELASLPPRERIQAVNRRMVDRVPFENLSNQRACRERPGEPDAWPRATDRFLREHRSEGLGGTSFTLAYALRDLLCGLGVNAHLTLGRNLVTEEMHAAVIAYPDDGGALLCDPSLLADGTLPLQPGARLEDRLGTVHLAPRRGNTLDVLLTIPGWTQPKPIYSFIPVPVPPQRFRQAWVASFCRGRESPLRIARRVGDLIRRWSERPGRLEVLTADGREQSRLDGAPAAELSRLFGIREEALRSWFDGQRPSP